MPKWCNVGFGVARIRNSKESGRTDEGMRTYIAPLGFDSRRVVRPVLSEGIDKDDRVVLLQPSTKSDRGIDSYKEVEEILTQVVPDLTLENNQLPHTDFVETILSCADLIRAAEGETIVILGGGAREILLPLTLATFSCSHAVETILQVGDIDGSVQRVPRLNLRGTISSGESEFLVSLSDLSLPLSISEIAALIGKSKSTVTRHVKRLETERLVRTSKEGRNKTVEITDSGRIYLSTREPRLL